MCMCLELHAGVGRYLFTILKLNPLIERETEKPTKKQPTKKQPTKQHTTKQMYE